jgi:RHS repeat-associated protein
VYDDQGNPTRINGFVYEGTEYNHAILDYQGRQLTSISIYSDSTGNTLVDTISYTYNDQGYRTSKTVDGTTIEYHLQGDKVLFETDGTYGIIYTYDFDGKLISFNYDSNVNDSTKGVEYYYIRNQQGDIAKIVDKDGDIVVEYYYDAWGNITKTTDTSGINLAEMNPYRYRGYRYDEEISMYYLNSRFYDSNLGRFINADGLLGPKGSILTHNVYTYTLNNPINSIDKTGEFPFLTTILVIATVAYAVTMVEDLIDLASGEVYFEPDDDGGGQIVNSSEIINPSVTLGYSLYLRYASEYTDSFDGSASGIAAEWNAHNAAYYWYTYFQKDEDKSLSAMHTDVGRTFFDDDRDEVVILTAIQMNPFVVAYDYFQHINKGVEDNE